MSVRISVIDCLDPIDLDELDATAALRTRVDRKYVLTMDQRDQLLSRLPNQARVLQIDGRRTFGYESTYFDTPSMDAYLGSAHRRRRRFKVRTRCYLDSGTCQLEVKLRDQRGFTVKHRSDHDPDNRRCLTEEAASFVRGFHEIAEFSSALEPVLTTRYRRSTVVLGTNRLTIDSGLVCDGGGAQQASLSDWIIVETKGGNVASTLDRILWAEHIRPATISKFGVGMAALHPSLPAAKWRRILREHVVVSDAT